MCKNCGGTYMLPEDAFWKTVIDVTESGKPVCYAEMIAPGYCLTCQAVTYPDADSIPGTWFGPNLRKKIANMHRVSVSLRSMQYLLASNHGIRASLGCISHALEAIATRGSLGDAPRLPEPKEDMPSPLFGAPFPTPARPEPDAGGHTAWNGLMRRPLITQITEKMSMAPSVSEDESGEKVAGKNVQAILLISKYCVLVCIRPDKTKETMRDVLWMVLNRPFVADMYRAGNALEGDFQTCFVHVVRKCEGLAIRHGVNSFEYAWYVTLLKIYRDAKTAARNALEMAGRAEESACDAGRLVKNTPGLEEYVKSSQDSLQKRILTLVDACRNGCVSDEKSRDFAGSLERAAPYLTEFIRHPGMDGNNNACERAVRTHIVRPRDIHHAFPNWKAADTFAKLQTIHATAEKLGMFSGDAVTADASQDMFGSGIPPPIFPNLK